MEYYKQLIIRILESSLVGQDNRILKKMKKNIDLTQDDRRELEELLESIM